MKLATMQPYLFPYIGYFQLINAVEKFVVLDDVTFIKSGWINRNNILLNNQPHLFSVPMEKASQNIKINQTKISYQGNWQSKLVKTFEQAYKKAPMYDLVMDMVSVIFTKNYTYISEMGLCSVKEVCKYLDINTVIINSSEVYKNETLVGENRIIDICLQEKAKIYINAPGGRPLYHHENFRSNNIELNFINTLPHQYKQFGKSFHPFMSIIDVLMFNNKSEAKSLLDLYALEM